MEVFARRKFFEIDELSLESARCEKIWAEDLNSGRVIRGVRVENPLERGTGK